MLVVDCLARVGFDEEVEAAPVEGLCRHHGSRYGQALRHQTGHVVAFRVLQQVTAGHRRYHLGVVTSSQCRVPGQMVVVIVRGQEELDGANSQFRFQMCREVIDEAVWVGAYGGIGGVTAVDEEAMALAIAHDVAVGPGVGHLEHMGAELAKLWLEALVRSSIEHLPDLGQIGPQPIDGLRT